MPIEKISEASFYKLTCDSNDCTNSKKTGAFSERAAIKISGFHITDKRSIICGECHEKAETLKELHK